jgi:metal-responsive CopG/Arc/MetJ family transcriptional regulator
MVGSAYVNSAIPVDLARRIDRLVEHADLGYRSRQEFVTDAARQLVLRMEEQRRLAKA